MSLPSVDVAVPTSIAAPQSFYQVDDPYEDSDNDDDKYIALCIPCTDDSATIPTGSTAVTVSTDAPQSPPPTTNQTTNTRQVSPSCIICLNQFAPNTYVCWSSNKECKHVFHRDCILLWLLKKLNKDNSQEREGGGALCPCCRQEFVLESVLNGDTEEENNVNAEVDIVAPPATATSEAAVDLVLDFRSSMLGQRQRVSPPTASHSNFPGNFRIG